MKEAQVTAAGSGKLPSLNGCAYVRCAIHLIQISTAAQWTDGDSRQRDRSFWESSIILQMPDRTGWIRWLPGILTLRQYQASWLARDVVAGVVLATMLVPVGIAYAVA